MIPIELPLALLLLATAVVVARLKDLVAAGMLTGIFSLLSAGLFTLMDAVDVAFTEAAVGAGVTTVLVLGTLSRTSKVERQKPPRLRSLVVIGLIGAALVYGSLDMPVYGDPEAPIHGYLAPDFFELDRELVHIPNVVTVILASFRGYDTLGETVVIFTAGVGVLMLLGSGRVLRRDERSAEESER